MKKTFIMSFFAVVLFLTGCNPGVYTLPSYKAPEDPVGMKHIIIPQEFEIISSDYTASISSTKDDGPASHYGRAFIKLFAKHKETGEEYLLIYEDIENRQKPIDIIKYVREPIKEIWKSKKSKK